MGGENPISTLEIDDVVVERGQVVDGVVDIYEGENVFEGVKVSRLRGHGAVDGNGQVFQFFQRDRDAQFAERLVEDVDEFLYGADLHCYLDSDR